MIANAHILITGGYGFLGGFLARELAVQSKGNKIVVFDRSTGAHTTGYDLKLNEFKNIRVVTGSILELDDLINLGDNFDYIIHAAGFLGIHKVSEQQLDNMDVNIMGTKNCLELAARQQQLKRYIQFSTSEIYGTESSNSSEDSDSIIKTTGERWTYAASKLAGEYYVKAYAQQYGVQAAIVRPFNVYGPHRYGSNAMTKLISDALAGKQLAISGDGQQIRSWCYVTDFCRGVVALLTAHTTYNCEAFNLGDDRKPLSMQELAKTIVKVTGSAAEVIIMGNTTEDVHERRPNITKARQRLQYQPSMSIEQGIEAVANWLRSNDLHSGDHNAK